MPIRKKTKLENKHEEETGTLTKIVRRLSALKSRIVQFLVEIRDDILYALGFENITCSKSNSDLKSFDDISDDTISHNVGDKTSLLKRPEPSTFLSPNSPRKNHLKCYENATVPNLPDRTPVCVIENRPGVAEAINNQRNIQGRHQEMSFHTNIAHTPEKGCCLSGVVRRRHGHKNCKKCKIEYIKQTPEHVSIEAAQLVTEFKPQQLEYNSSFISNTDSDNKIVPGTSKHSLENNKATKEQPSCPGGGEGQNIIQFQGVKESDTNRNVSPRLNTPTSRRKNMPSRNNLNVNVKSVECENNIPDSELSILDDRSRSIEREHQQTRVRMQKSQERCKEIKLTIMKCRALVQAVPMPMSKASYESARKCRENLGELLLTVNGFINGNHTEKLLYVEIKKTMCEMDDVFEKYDYLSIPSDCNAKSTHTQTKSSKTQDVSLHKNNDPTRKTLAKKFEQRVQTETDKNQKRIIAHCSTKNTAKIKVPLQPDTGPSKQTKNGYIAAAKFIPPSAKVAEVSVKETVSDNSTPKSPPVKLWKGNRATALKAKFIEENARPKLMPKRRLELEECGHNIQATSSNLNNLEQSDIIATIDPVSSDDTPSETAANVLVPTGSTGATPKQRKRNTGTIPKRKRNKSRNKSQCKEERSRIIPVFGDKNKASVCEANGELETSIPANPIVLDNPQNTNEIIEKTGCAAILFPPTVDELRSIWTSIPENASDVNINETIRLAVEMPTADCAVALPSMPTADGAMDLFSTTPEEDVERLNKDVKDYLVEHYKPLIDFLYNPTPEQRAKPDYESKKEKVHTTLQKHVMKKFRKRFDERFARLQGQSTQQLAPLPASADDKSRPVSQNEQFELDNTTPVVEAGCGSFFERTRTRLVNDVGIYAEMYSKATEDADDICSSQTINRPKSSQELSDQAISASRRMVELIKKRHIRISQRLSTQNRHNLFVTHNDEADEDRAYLDFFTEECEVAAGDAPMLDDSKYKELDISDFFSFKSYIETNNTLDNCLSIKPGHGDRPDKKKLAEGLREKVKTKGQPNKHLENAKPVYNYTELEEGDVECADEINDALPGENIEQETRDIAEMIEIPEIIDFEQRLTLDDREFNMVPDEVIHKDSKESKLKDLETMYAVDSPDSKKDKKKRDKKKNKKGKQILDLDIKFNDSGCNSPKKRY